MPYHCFEPEHIRLTICYVKVLQGVVGAGGGLVAVVVFIDQMVQFKQQLLERQIVDECGW